MKIGDRLRTLRRAKKISQKDLAKLADIHRVYIGLLEHDERSPTVEVLGRICKALDIKMAEFFDGIDD
jgi:transcriptional regulator with XRE-family HTH domain